MILCNFENHETVRIEYKLISKTNRENEVSMIYHNHFMEKEYTQILRITLSFCKLLLKSQSSL